MIEEVTRRNQTMMHEMMQRCCTAEGKPDFEKMKAFMQGCGKQGFGEGEIAMMKQFCGEAGMPVFR